MRNKLYLRFAWGSLLFMLLARAWGQEGAPPVPAEPDQSGTSSDQIQDNTGTEKIDPDSRPLSGDEYLSPGTPEGARNILNSSIRVDQRLDSNARSSGTGSTWQGDSDVYGDVTLQRSWKRNAFSLDYDGGGTFYADRNAYSTQQLALSQILTFRRWSFMFTDQVTYSPESTFGLPQLPPVTLNILGTLYTLTPNQTVLTNQVTRISNTSIAQAEYAVSRHTSLTASGSYGLLDYLVAGATNNNQVSGTLGYNYRFTPHDTVALTYTYESLRFAGPLASAAIDINITGLSFAHQLTGRLSFQVGGGAELVKIPGPPATTKVYPNGQAQLTYAWRHAQLGLTASQALMSGMGLFTATNATIVQANLSRTFSRTWDGSINIGFAENSVIGIGQSIRTGYAGLNLHKALGRYAGMYLMYNLQRQSSDLLCSGPICAQNLIRQSIGVGLDWRFRPVVFH
jgi:hypothetical protein